MKFLVDLIGWFICGECADASSTETYNSAVLSAETASTQPAGKPVIEFDIHKEADPKVLMRELHSLKSLTQQFETAREELLQELRRLAPIRKSKNFRKNAA